MWSGANDGKSKYPNPDSLELFLDLLLKHYLYKCLQIRHAFTFYWSFIIIRFWERIYKYHKIYN